MIKPIIFAAILGATALVALCGLGTLIFHKPNVQADLTVQAVTPTEFPLFEVDEHGLNTEMEWTFMEVHVMNHGKTDNEKFFIGPLPEVGDAVEMVYIGSRESGAMRFMLRTKSHGEPR